MAGLPIAVGAAHALRQRGAGQVAIAFFGDGAIAAGAFHEAVNLAALWRLPVAFVCENNGFSEFSRASDQHPVPVESRAAGYGIPFRRAAGNDVADVADVMEAVLAGVRAGRGPYLVEAVTMRVRGHYEGDPQRYRDPSEVADAKLEDPLIIARRRLADFGVDPARADELDREAAEELADAERFARASSAPDPATLLEFVISRACGRLRPRRETHQEQVPPTRPGAGPLAPAPPLSVARIIRQALQDAMADDHRVFLAGIYVGGGNVFGLTRGLQEGCPGRVRDTPISETAIIGTAVGSARPACARSSSSCTWTSSACASTR